MQLNYPSLLKESQRMRTGYFPLFMKHPWDKMVEIDPCFHLKKLKGDLCSFIPGDMYDLIYFDAFAPKNNRKCGREKSWNALYRL